MTGRRRYQWGLVLVAAALLVTWVLVDGGGRADPDATSSSPSASPTHDFTATATPSTDPVVEPTTDPESGLPIVPLSALPPEAARTVELIDRGGPFPEPEHDGGTFQNREELLPDRPMGYYKEYTVPTPGSDDRGARRIVAGEGGELYYTGDHYSSFSRIARP